MFSGVAFSDIPIREYYPAVSLQSQRECVKCNFKGPFKFDIEGFIQEYEIRQNAGIQAEKISEMRVREFVISYLIANGYVKTLKTLGSYESYDSMGMITYSRIGDRVLDYELEESELATIKEVSSDESWTDYSLSDSSRINLSLETEETLKTVYLSTLNIRSEIRECIMKGNIEYAINYISEHYPRVLQTSKEADLALKIQQFIEIIKTQEVYSAFEYARNNLSCYRNSLIMVRKEVDSAVNISEVLGLLCYTDPFTSPLAYLLGKQQLEMTADIVNEEIISNTYLECEGVRYENSIEILLKQLLLVHKEYRKQHLLCPTDDISLLI